MRFFSMGAWAAQSGVARAVRQSGDERDGRDLGLWDEAGYRDHLAAVAPSLPASLVDATSERRQRIEALDWNPDLQRLELIVSSAGGTLSTWRYRGVSHYEWLDHRVRLDGDGAFGFVGCHELHRPPGAQAAFEHRMLLSSGMELAVIAEEFERAAQS